MSFRYVPFPSEEIAEEFARKCFELIRPLSLSKPGDATKYCGGWLVHQHTGAVVFEFPTAYIMRISPIADQFSLDPYFQADISTGNITESELYALNSAITERKGDGMILYNFIPQYWRNISKSLQDLIAEDWFYIEQY